MFPPKILKLSSLRPCLYCQTRPRLGRACTAKPARAAHSIVEYLHADEGWLGDSGDDHLRDTFPARDGEGLLSMINQQDFDFTAIIRVNRAGRCLLYTSPSPRDLSTSRMPSSA